MPIHPRCRERDSWNVTESKELQNVIPYDFLQLYTSQIIHVESRNCGFPRLEASCWNMVSALCNSCSVLGHLSPTLDLPPNGLFVCFAGWNWASSLGNGFCATLSSAKLADGKMVGVKHVTSSCVRRISFRDFHISPRNEHSTSEMVLGRKTIFMVSPFELVLKLFTSTLIYTVSLIAMWMFLQMLE